MKIVVDLFNQHSGNLEELNRMALSAYLSGADIVKIQLLNSKRIWGDYSRKHLEMTHDDFKEFWLQCAYHGIKTMATVFDEQKLEWLDDFEFDYYKIASHTSFNDKSLCEKILAKNKPTIISTGLYKLGEFPFGFNSNIQYLYCVAEYPTFLFNPKLKEMPMFKNEQGFYSGFSDHVVGTAAALKAYFNGAQILEKHFTHDVNAQNSVEKAHLCSFTPDSLRVFKNTVRELDIISS